jgi:tRNA pseudouridine38-40 synthase
LRYFFHIAYKGNRYHGWQRQPNVLNVQQVVVDALARILKTGGEDRIMGCGRTDAQVHASQFFFHLDIMTPWDFDLMYRLNKLLPPDIAVFEIIPVEENQHARFDAMQRTYNYFLHTYKDPFLNGGSALYMERNLDIDKMKEATHVFMRYNDYMAFCKTPAKYKHTLCNLSSATLFTDTSGEKIRFEISANRFLSRMVRMMMGALLDIGRKKISIDELETYLISKVHPEFIKPAYPQGLYLSKVTYRYLDIPARSEFSPILQNTIDNWVAV